MCWMISNCAFCYLCFDFGFFFFKQKTAYEMRISDWSSDVCSSDLAFGRRRRDRMQKSMIMASAAALVLLAGCEKAEAPAPAPTDTTTTEAPIETAPVAGAETTDPATAPHRFASWAGKWTGVEGMYVTNTPAEHGTYKLEMPSDRDTKRSE